MARLRCQIDDTDPVSVMRLVGTLVAQTVPTVWSAVLRHLADQPDALVVDLTELDLPEPSALAVFVALAHRASVWPGISLIACTPSAEAHRALSRQSVTEALAVCPSRDEAVLLASGTPAPRRMSIDLQPAVGAAREARNLATEACLRWGVPSLAPRAAVIASELVANAVRHARTPMTLTLARTLRYVQIAVCDGSTEPAIRQHPSPLSPSGRGLMIVERTALTWGSTEVSDGKVVWAALRVGE